MTMLVPIALVGWIGVVFALFALLPARRAVAAAFVLGVLLLPMAGYKVMGLPAYDKTSATVLGVVIAAAAFHGHTALKFRPSWMDLPMLCWCIAPLFSSLLNGLGWYDGFSGVFAQLVSFGLPYLIGRVFLGELQGVSELATWMLIGGLIYVPLCLYEIRMSPQLHNMLYGFHQHDWLQTYRLGGYRPTVFMQHGLMVAMWMAAASIAGVWLWRSGAVKRLWGAPMLLLVPPLVVTTILCKSLGAIGLCMAGIVGLWLAMKLRSRIAIVVMILFPLMYLPARALNLWTGRELIEISAAVSPEAAGRLRYRLDNEVMLTAKALEKPLFGWGGWGRGQVYDESGRQVSVPDGMWIIAFGNSGAFGLVALYAGLLLPPILVLTRVHPGWMADARAGPLAALGMILLLYSVDCLFNAMVNPVFFLTEGAVVGACLSLKQARRAGARPAVAAPREGFVVPVMPSAVRGAP